MANKRFIDFPIATTVGDNDIILIWQGGANKQTTKATILSGVPDSLNDLTDVTISGLTNGQILRYDSVTGQWENTDQGNLDLNDLNDVTIVSPTNGQVLVYNSSTSKWENSSGGYVPYVGAVTTVNLGAQTIQAGSFVKQGGTSSQFLKADGSVDSTAYGTGSVTSVGLTMPAAFNVANSPITTAGTLAVTGAGTVAQYIRGDGSLADFPESSGGGSSVSYYLNGSVDQGTIGGIAYKELSKVPILGAGTDFTINADGYIASFITDAGDPNLLEIPGGNWNFETYFSASSSGGTPTFYVELYKVSGTTATLIASSSSAPELIAFGTNLNPYFSTLAVPTTTLALTDRLAVRYYVTHSGRTITLHTENNHLCQIITTFTTGLTALNGLTAQVQNFAVGTTGTDFNIASATATHTFNLPTASATNRGALSSADWSTFNAKQNALTLTTSGTSGAATLVGATLNIPQYQAALTNPVTGTGSAGQVAYWSSASAITGESALFWDATNNRLGIDASSPSSALEVRLPSSTLTNNIKFGDSTVGYLTSGSLGVFLSGNDGISRIMFTHTGDVGIGNNGTNGFKFDVTGTGRFTSNLTANSFIKSGGTSSQYLMADGSVSTLTNPVTGTGVNGRVAIWNGSSTITSDGDLLFSGTELNVSGIKIDGSSVPYIVSTLAGNDLNIQFPVGQGLNLGNNAGEGVARIIKNNITLYNGASTIQTSIGNLTISTGGGNGNIILSPNGSGNVGIGVTPSAWTVNAKAIQLPQFVSLSNQNNGSLNLMSFALETSADAFTYADTGVFPARLNMNPNNGSITLFGAGTGTAGNPITWASRLAFTSTGAATFGSNVTASSFIRSGGTSSQYLMADGSVSTLSNPVTGTGTTNYLPKFTGSTTIGNSALQETNGNLGLGVTPSAWTLFSGVLELKGGPAIGGFANTTYFLQNSNFDSGFKYKSNGTAGRYELGGQHSWWIAPSGTAGNAISFTQAMTLFSTGNLLVGSPSPISDNGARLQVSGRVSATGNDFHTLAVQEGSAQLRLERTVNSTGVAYLGADSTGFSVFNSSFTRQLTIASTGAATFSSSVTANGGFEIPNGQFYRARRTSGNLLTDMIGIPSGTNDVRIVTTGAFQVISGGLTTFLNISDTGAATFNTTGTAANVTINNSVGNDLIYLDAAINTDYAFKITSGADDMLTLRRQHISQGNRDIISFGFSGNVGIGSTSPGVRLVNSGATLASVPTLGSGTIGANAILSANGFYGLYTGVASAGHVWQQVQRNDGNTAVYNLALQPNGANVLIGTTTDNGLGARLQVRDFATITGFATPALSVRNESGVFAQLGVGVSAGFVGTSSNHQLNFTANSVVLATLKTDGEFQTNAISTSSPVGGTAAIWKLGKVATVSPTSPNRTIEVEVAGTIYYLHAKTTNN